MTTPATAAAAPAGAGDLPAPLRPRGDPALRSGQLVALLFQRTLALVALVAFASLAVQVDVLIASRGLLPAELFFERAREDGRGFWDEPSLLWWAHGDGALLAGAWLGVLLSGLALSGLRPRLCFALCAPLYLSYATAGGDFLAFQWDNMLVECLLLGALLPADRPAPLLHFAMRMLLFKLYFESGIAKWQSHLHDWHDGSAMRFYYETAPLPAALGFYAHQLPPFAQKLSSWGALVLELAVPLLVFGPRRARLIAFAAFTSFQFVNTATANYGFFTYLSVTLHLFLLSDRDVQPLLARLRLRAPAARTAVPRSGVRVATGSAIALWMAASSVSALVHFSRSGALERALVPLYELYTPFRAANAYHLFGHITRERVEPQFETREAEQIREHDLYYKPGDPERRPPYVAPHQPRVDFRLWFYGLSARRGTPRYVANLLERLCEDPAAVQPLFDAPLPQAPDAVRIAFYRYRFTRWAEKRATGAYWKRELVGRLPERACR